MIITKEATGAVSEVYDRMPVILRVDQIEAWLCGEMTPEDIVNMDFGDTAVAPCEDGGDTDEGGQMSLFP